MDDSINVTVVSHTHWDRAWYTTFQEFRARLVRLVDRLITILQEDPGFHVFMLDGQMAILEDYLEVRPQRQSELECLCKEGRLKVGPWYVLADEFLVSPEALIRNMQLGHRMGETYGGVSKIGYVPDGFGHIAQLPQILRGFGIDSAFFWRGLGEEGESLGTEFIWKAPDGSKVTTIWMPLGYHNLSNLGYPIHWGDTSQMEFDPELALEQIQKAIAELKPRTNTRSILLMNGIDHEEAEPRLPEILSLARNHLEPDTFTQGTLEEYLTRVRKMNAELPEHQGEFRWGKYSEVLQGVYATRIHLKQVNHRVETLFERYAEPLLALAWWAKAEIPEGTQDLLWTGWRWLLRNHPHDDIYGSGIDKVHEEMLYRFDQAEQIGQILVRDSLRQLARQIDFTRHPGMPVLVFNPLGWDRNEITEGDLDFDCDDPTADHFRIVDRNGDTAPHQVLSDQPVFWMETLKPNRKRRVKVAFKANVPGCGYAAYTVQPGQIEPGNELGDHPDPLMIHRQGLWVIQPNGAENKFISIKIDPDGGVDLTDKVTGASYVGLGHYEDIADAGDEYSFCPLINGQTISTKGKAAEISLTAAGINQVTFEIRRRWIIPAGLSEDRSQRSKETRILSLLSRITMYRDHPVLFFESEVENQACDHKLSVVFPTSINPETVFVDQPFMVMERPIDLPVSTGWVEDPTPLMHQRAFTDLCQNGQGLAIFNRGLPAVEVTREENGVKMSLVLLRCVGWLSRDDLWTRRVAAGPLVPTPGAQCPGGYRFEYAIFPHSGDWQSVYPWAYGYSTPLTFTRADTHEGLELKEMNITRDDPSQVRRIPWPRGGPMPDSAGIIAVEPSQLVLSSLHRGKDGKSLVVRYYNISGESVAGRLESPKPLHEAWICNLNEDCLEQIPLQDGHLLHFNTGGHQVISILLRY